MKVMCIDATQGNLPHKHLLQEGNIYDAYQCPFDEGDYKLYELPMCGCGCKLDASYSKDKFILLSEIDETEMVREKQFQTT